MLEIVLRHKGKKYKVIDKLAEWSTDENDQPIEGDCYIWTEGNYSCDCNRSLFILRGPDPSFPEMKCGETIKLVSMTAPERQR